MNTIQNKTSAGVAPKDFEQAPTKSATSRSSQPSEEQRKAQAANASEAAKANTAIRAEAHADMMHTDAEEAAAALTGRNKTKSAEKGADHVPDEIQVSQRKNKPTQPVQKVDQKESDGESPLEALRKRASAGPVTETAAAGQIDDAERSSLEDHEALQQETATMKDAPEMATHIMMAQFPKIAGILEGWPREASSDNNLTDMQMKKMGHPAGSA